MAPYISTDQLARRIVKLANGKEEIDVFVALEAALESLIEQISTDDFRNQLTAYLLLIIVQSPAFQNIPPCEHSVNLGEIAAIEDIDIRNKRIIAAMRSLKSAFVPLPKYARLRPDLKLLNPRYRADQNVGARVFLRQLGDMFSLAGATARQIPDKRTRAQLMLMGIQAFISWSGFDRDEISKLKEILVAVAGLPDEEFTNDAVEERIESFVSAADL